VCLAPTLGIAYLWLCVVAVSTLLNAKIIFASLEAQGKLMRKFATLVVVILLAAWGSVTTAVDMNRVEGDRLSNCMQQRFQEVERAARDKVQSGQAGEIYRPLPSDLWRACQLAPPTGG